jgi:tetratricopeptide (TPR) repeat protein
MKATDDLHQLIQSLSQAEKRYVKVFASKQLAGEGNNYMRLFEAIAAQAEYDEDAIKLNFARELFIRHLPSEKIYLYKFILKSMRSFHSERSLDAALKEMILNARFLFDKRLYAQGQKVLQKVKAISRKFEKYTTLMEIILMERTLVLENALTDVSARLHTLQADTEEAIKTLNDEIALMTLKEEMFSLSRNVYHLRSRETLRQIDALVKKLPQSGLNESFSLNAAVYYHHVMVLHYQFNAMYDEAVKEYRKIIQLYETRPDVIKNEPKQYRIALSNYLSHCQAANKFDDFPEVLEKIRKIPTSSLNEEIDTFKNVAYLELLYYMNCDICKALEIIPDIESGLKKYRSHIHKARELAFYHNISVLYFVSGKYKMALKWLGYILNDEKSEARTDIQEFAKIFQLVLHYELRSFDLLDYLCRTTYRYFQRKDPSYPFEALVIGLIKKLNWETEAQKTTACFAEFYQNLELLSQDSVHKKSLGLPEMQLWASARFKNITMTELLNNTTNEKPETTPLNIPNLKTVHNETGK